MKDKTKRPVRALLAAGLALAATAALGADAPLEKVTVRAVAHFGFDGTTIAPADEARILAEVGQMKDVSWQTVTAVGHTDSLGPSDYNAGLSARRADAVKRYLVGKGLSPEMIRTAAKAADAPAADNATASGRAKNRRTEIEFQGVRSTPR